MKRIRITAVLVMLGMIASFPAFTQIDTTRLVGVKAYKLGYLIRDAKALRACDSLAEQQQKNIEIKNRLNEGFKKEISSLKKENKALIQKDSSRQVNAHAAEKLLIQDKADLKAKIKRKNRIILVETSLIAILLLALLL